MMTIVSEKLNKLSSIKKETLSQWALILLVILMGWAVSKLFWGVSNIFTHQPINTDIKLTTNVSSSPQKLASSIIKNHLFGNAASVTKTRPEPEIIAENVPETRLNLKLRGIYASDDSSLSNAIIENERGLQDLYFIGDKIPGERNLQISKILKDKIILNRNGNFETLTMEDFGSKVKTKSIRTTGVRRNFNKQKRLIDKRNNQQLSRQLFKIKNQMVNDPKSLAGLMNVRPVTQNGQFKGFRVSPGRNASLFARAGLRRNDLVTSINGIVIDDPSKALVLLDELRNAQELNLEIVRGSQPLSLVFSLNDNTK